MTTFADASDTYLETPAEPRTSALAVASFVSSMICCIPLLSIFLGLFGAGLGVVSLVLIGRSNGRLRGRGFAFAGVALGLFAALFWIGVLAGANKYAAWMVGRADAAVAAIDQGDFAAARATFVPSLDKAVTDEQLRVFADMLADEFGAYRRAPGSPLEWFSMLGDTGDSMRNFAGMGRVIPIGFEFENGHGVIMILPPQSGDAADQQRFISNLGFLAADGTEVWLREIEPGGDGEPGADDPDR